MESLVFTLKEGFEFGEMVRRTHENVLPEMLEKVLAYKGRHPGADTRLRRRPSFHSAALLPLMRMRNRWELLGRCQ